MVQGEFLSFSERDIFQLLHHHSFYPKLSVTNSPPHAEKQVVEMNNVITSQDRKMKGQLLSVLSSGNV